MHVNLENLEKKKPISVFAVAFSQMILNMKVNLQTFSYTRVFSLQPLKVKHSVSFNYFPDKARDCGCGNVLPANLSPLIFSDVGDTLRGRNTTVLTGIKPKQTTLTRQRAVQTED